MERNGDLISRQAAIDAVSKALDRQTLLYGFVRKVALDAIKNLPSTQPEITVDGYADGFADGYKQGQKDAQSEPQEIGYTDCANAMLKMWIDNVLTDGEYSRIMDKLNAHWRK